jgi:hypothetical protein
MAWTLRRSMVILLWEMMNLRRCPVVTQNTHLRGFKRDVVLMTPLEDDP